MPVSWSLCEKKKEISHKLARKEYRPQSSVTNQLRRTDVHHFPGKTRLHAASISELKTDPDTLQKGKLNLDANPAVWDPAGSCLLPGIPQHCGSASWLPSHLVEAVEEDVPKHASLSSEGKGYKQSSS